MPVLIQRLQFNQFVVIPKYQYLQAPQTVLTCSQIWEAGAESMDDVNRQIVNVLGYMLRNFSLLLDGDTDILKLFRQEGANN